MSRRGFTMIEVLATLLVVALGLTAAIGLFSYGLKRSLEAQARASALATAATVLHDPTPLLDPDLAGDWMAGSYDFDADQGAATTQGLINGWFVQRRETSTVDDIIARRIVGGAQVVYARSVHVEVDVYDAKGSRLLASLDQRFVRQRGGP